MKLIKDELGKYLRHWCVTPTARPRGEDPGERDFYSTTFKHINALERGPHKRAGINVNKKSREGRYGKARGASEEEKGEGAEIGGEGRSVSAKRNGDAKKYWQSTKNSQEGREARAVWGAKTTSQYEKLGGQVKRPGRSYESDQKKK